MNTRGRHLVNLVKGTEQQQQFESLNETNDKRPESPVPYEEYTEEESRVLNNIYDDIFPNSPPRHGEISYSLDEKSCEIFPISSPRLGEITFSIDEKSCNVLTDCVIQVTPIPLASSEETLNLVTKPDDMLNTNQKHTPMPSSSSGQDFSCESPYHALNNEIQNIDEVLTTPQTANDSLNIPSISSLISASDIENPLHCSSQKKIYVTSVIHFLILKTPMKNRYWLITIILQAKKQQENLKLKIKKRL
nr:uncharacterized protein LOC128683853 isoform X2 [Plodia interpunctella]